MIAAMRKMKTKYVATRLAESSSFSLISGMVPRRGLELEDFPPTDPRAGLYIVARLRQKADHLARDFEVEVGRAGYTQIAGFHGALVPLAGPIPWRFGRRS